MDFMKKFSLGLALIFGSLGCFATNCPDPQTTSLRWGEIPSPWIANPYSRPPTGEEDTRFIRAHILVAGYGRGVSCTYYNGSGEYSIWWPVLTKIPAPQDYNWINTLGGFVCAQGLEQCQFSVIA
jgi:hypothetical protein